MTGWEYEYKKTTKSDGYVTQNAELAYRFDIIISMIFTISKIILAYVLWARGA